MKKTTTDNDKFVYLKSKFNSRAHARQEMKELYKKQLITNYRIAWDTQLRMTVEVVYSPKSCTYETHKQHNKKSGVLTCNDCGMII